MKSVVTRLLCLATLLLATLIGNAQAATSEPVRIPSAGISSSPQALHGHRFTPAGPGPHPAVIMLHGCGGAYDRQGNIGARQRMWGEYLASHGYAALLLDSFSSRGIRQICTIKFDQRALKEADRSGDAYAALAWLSQQPEIDAQRISLLGWSHGGGVTLHAISHRPNGGNGFKSAVSFYPGCSARAKKANQFHPYAPVLLLIGAADDWTPAAPCQALTDSVAKRGEPMHIVLYPDSYHDFDNPSLTTQHVRKDVPNGVRPGQGVTVAPNVAAREDAKRRVINFLASK